MYSIALKFTQKVASMGASGPILFVMEDLLLHQFKEKQIFDAAGQPFAPQSIVSSLYDNSGLFQASENAGTGHPEVTTLLSLDKQSSSAGDAASSLMFKVDELALEKHVDSLADQIIEFTSEECKLTKGLRPQMGLQFVHRPMDGWQSPYLKNHVAKPFQSIIRQIDASQKKHYAKKEFKLTEDPWENYLFYDAQ